MRLLLFGLILASHAALAASPILLEACNALEPASKRLECLKEANGASLVRSAPAQNVRMPQNVYDSPAALPARRSINSDRVCHVGPRGGTYTITASGKKNYSGC